MKSDQDFPRDRFLIFEELVREHFHFLESDYGLRLASVDRDGDVFINLKYSSAKIFVSLWYGRPGYELELNLGRVGIDDQPGAHSFTAGDLLYLGCEKWPDYKVYSAHSYKNLREGLPLLSSFLKECGKACLRGDNDVYEKMAVKRTQAHREWDQNEKLKQVRQLANTAWEMKDYAKVVELFEPILTKLNPSERLKLEYSKKHLVI